VYDAFRYFLRLPGKRFQREGYDFRKFQYDVERHQREHPLLYVDDHWETSSVSWHPTQKLLVTAGTGNQAKLWNVETGELVTENPCWSSYSSGKSITWSDDAEVFAVDKYSFDGHTGELLPDAPKETHDWTYSSSEYDSLRGSRDYYCHGVSHVASTHNFTSFKPNSPHRVIKNEEKNLIFRHRLTGEIERVIDCDVPSAIRDFAWHPKGQFIAIAFKEHNVSIVDTDEVRTIDSLSAQHLAGWSPDGKTLVVRRGWKVTDDFVVWDALETKEQPITEEIKNELWFKRFFNNVSADGLRYVRIEGREGKIYSLLSHELLATLPGPVTCAAWSPIDGGLLATCSGSKTHIWSI
jgi:WD40 repeat protein